MKNIYKIQLIGVGGQGTIKASTIIGEAAMKKGLNVVMSEVCQAVIPYMKEKNYGKIVNISSLVAKQARLSGAPSYGASKAGLLYLTRHLAKEFGPFGIYVNAICPGQIVAYMTRHWTEEHKKELISETPLRRLGYPDDVAKAILFLSSDLSSYVNGESINVNGGYIMD